jgi:hypothetical protein
VNADSLSYDTLGERPLPKWLTDQKTRNTTAQTEKEVVKKDHSLTISFIATFGFLILVVAVWTLYLIRKHKKKAQ